MGVYSKKSLTGLRNKILTQLSMSKAFSSQPYQGIPVLRLVAMSKICSVRNNKNKFVPI